MTVLTIGQATKAFIAEHVEWHRNEANYWGRPFSEKAKHDELMVIAVSLSIAELWQLERVVQAMLPVTSAIAAAMVTDNQ